MKLEQLRYEDLGLIQLGIAQKGKPGVRFLVHFDHFANLAYKSTILSLQHLENSNIVTTDTDYSINAIGFWFFAIESFVNTIWKVISVIDSRADFKSIRKWELSKRISELLEFLDVDREAFYKGGSYARLNEFIQFRNDIFHDRQHGVLIDYKKTIFSKVPPLVNQVDAMQSMIIAIEVFSYLRYVFSGLDIMPQVIYFPNNTKAFNKVDLMYDLIVKPSFMEILKKHQLESDLDLSYSKEVFARTKYFDIYDIAFLIKAEKGIDFRFSSEQSEILLNHNKKLAESDRVPFDQFRLPSYGKRL